MTNQLVQTALAISEKRRQILARMRKAVQARDKDTVFLLAQQLTGLTDEERSSSPARLN